MSQLSYRIDKRLAHEGILSTVGHGALDVAGLVPGIGETADLANVVWYAKDGDYLNAAFSLVSLVPVVGDLMGKGSKYIGKVAPKVLLRKLAPALRKHWDDAIKIGTRSGKLKPYLAKMDAAVKQGLQSIQ